VDELVEAIAEAMRRDPDHPAIEYEGDPVTTFVDPARLKTTILAFLESLVWWGREGPVRIGAERRDGRFHLWASRQGTELATEAAEALFTPRRPGEGAGSKIGLFVSRGVAEAQGERAARADAQASVCDMSASSSSNRLAKCVRRSVDRLSASTSRPSSSRTSRSASYLVSS
jgi:hypothetical protein